MVFQGKIPSEITRFTESARKWKDVSRNDSPASRAANFIQAEGTHIQLSRELPFVLAVNGGEILVHILEEFEIQLHRENLPTIVYVEPGPNVSTLDSGTSFTLFVHGVLYLVQVLRVLRQPDSTKAVTVNLLSLSPGGAASPASEDLQAQAPPCSGSTPHHRLPTPESAVDAHCPSTDLDSSSSSAPLADFTLWGPTPPLQIPIPTPSTVHQELLSPNYGWPRTTSPVPLTNEDKVCCTPPRLTGRATPHAITVGNSFMCPPRTHNTTGQPSTDSLAAQHGSLLSHNTTAVQPNIWPSSVLAPFGLDAGTTVDRPNSPLEENTKSEARLTRITGAGRFSRVLEAHGRYTSLRPELDPKVSVANDHAVGFRYPSPIGTGRPHGPDALPPIDQSLFCSHWDGVPAEALDASSVFPDISPFSRGVSSIKQEYSAFFRIVERNNLPAMPTVDIDANPFIRSASPVHSPTVLPDGNAGPSTLQPVVPIPLRPFGTPLRLEVTEDTNQSAHCCDRQAPQMTSPSPYCNVENQSRLLLSLLPTKMAQT